MPANLVVEPAYNDAAVSFDGADGATYYTVAYKASGESSYTSVSDPWASGVCELAGLSPHSSYDTVTYKAAGESSYISLYHS